MKKKLLLIFIVCLLFTSCNKTDKNENTIQSTTDTSNITCNTTVYSSEEIPQDTQTTETETATSYTEAEASQTTSVVTTTSIEKTVKVTIPEGYTVARLASLLEEKNVCNKDEFLQKCNSNSYSSYPLIASIKNKSQRAFLVEGYLRPNTYEFYTNEKPENVISRLIKNTEAYFSDDMKAKAQASGFTPDDIIIIASIIEKECNTAAERANVSAVIHNRLKANMKLDMDSTIKYIEGAVKPYISGDVNRYNSLYNTYKCSALPSGPICNPSQACIDAALNPSSIDALYFFTTSDGRYFYSTSYDEHKAAMAEVGMTENQFQS